MGEAAESGVHQRPRILGVEDVGRHLQIVFASVVDDGLGQVEGNLALAAQVVVHPNLDQVDFPGGEPIDILDHFIDSGNFERNAFHAGSGGGVAAGACETAARSKN